MKFNFGKSFKRVRKQLKTACITAALVTSWQAGEQAKANYTYGDNVTLRFSGIVSPSNSNVQHLKLLYGTGYSSCEQFRTIDLGDFGAGQPTTFSVTTQATMNTSLFWYVFGTYGDISSGQYISGLNGVTLVSQISETLPWSEISNTPETEAFGAILAGTYKNSFWEHDMYCEFFTDLSFTTTGDIISYSQPVNNGQFTLTSQVIPEPFTILLLGTGGVFLLRRRDNKSQAG